MVIDDKIYKLPTCNYIPKEYDKKRIILASSNNKDMKHYNGWLTRYNGKYTKTAPFTINKDGLICKHFEPKYSSNYFSNLDFNNDSIIVLLENEGWLTRGDINNEFITSNGYIYNKPKDIIEKTWRGFNFWFNYTQPQFEAALELVVTLCDRFDIPMSIPSHNTKIDDLKNYSGILYRSNIERYYTDLNPSWDYKLFKEKIEKYERTY